MSMSSKLLLICVGLGFCSACSDTPTRSDLSRALGNQDFVAVRQSLCDSSPMHGLTEVALSNQFWSELNSMGIVMFIQILRLRGSSELVRHRIEGLDRAGGSVSVIKSVYLERGVPCPFRKFFVDVR
jgi:hypothetical protein